MLVVHLNCDFYLPSQFTVTWSPGLVSAKEALQTEPSIAGNCLEPVLCSFLTSLLWNLVQKRTLTGDHRLLSQLTGKYADTALFSASKLYGLMAC